MNRLRRVKPGQFLTLSGMFFILAGMVSFVGGMSAYTFIQAEGHSYFSDDPSSCVNCHVMQDQFDAWGHSSHARVATCNDCHSPHNNLLNKYFAKGVNGFNHSAAFTLNTYDQVITIKDFNVTIVNDSCVYCHADLTHNIVSNQDDSLKCTSCHAGVGHPIRN